jgi:hypothetical protein
VTLHIQRIKKHVACKNIHAFNNSIFLPTLDALVVEDDLLTVRLVTVEGGAFSAASNAGTRGVPGGVRSLRNALQMLDKIRTRYVVNCAHMPHDPAQQISEIFR